MLIVITERVDDVRHSIDAAHARFVFTLAAEDAGRTLGYANVIPAAPVGRRDGVAVVAGDDHVGIAPDPVRIVVRDQKTPDPSGVTLCVRRAALPLLLKVDGNFAWVLSRILPPLIERAKSILGADEPVPLGISASSPADWAATAHALDELTVPVKADDALGGSQSEEE